MQERSCMLHDCQESWDEQERLWNDQLEKRMLKNKNEFDTRE